MPGQYIKNLIAALWRELPLNTTALALRQTPHLPGTQSCVGFCNVSDTRWVLDVLQPCCAFIPLHKYMGVSKNRGTPKSSILIGFSTINPSILGYPWFLETPTCSSKVDRIKRYGGTTSSEKPWPEEPERLTDEELSDTVASRRVDVDVHNLWFVNCYMYVLWSFESWLSWLVNPPQKTFQWVCLMMLGSPQPFPQMGK